MTDPETLLDICRTKGLMLGTAESCTGGMVAAAITDIPGASDVFERGIVTYSNEAKTALLGVRAATFASHGAVSEEVACEMAEGLRKHAPVDIAIAISGIAGPGGSENKPEGRVCFAVATEAVTQSETVEFGAIGRAEVRAAATARAIDLLASAARKL
ncbi:MAG: CinA family protein [Maritimibacter sp.]|jgi:nicotinamide-nucleotide amidase